MRKTENEDGGIKGLIKGLIGSNIGKEGKASKEDKPDKEFFNENNKKDNFPQILREEDGFDYILVNNNLLIKELEDYKEHKYFSEIINTTSHLPLSLKQKLLMIIKTLDCKHINKDILNSYVFTGLDEAPSLRALCWKVLLDVLPKDINQWEAEINQKRSKYENLKNKYILKNKFITDKHFEGKQVQDNDLDKPQDNDKDKDKENINFQFKEILSNQSEERKIIGIEEQDNYIIKTVKIVKSNNRTIQKAKLSHPLHPLHPLNQHHLQSTNQLQKVNKQINSYEIEQLKDLAIYEEILLDTKRTRSYMNFFSQESMGQMILTNILFIYSKENSDIKYSQGMNEIIAPLLYCFNMDSNIFFRRFIEHDSYYCFTEIFKALKVWYIDNYFNVPLKIKEFENMLSKRESQLLDIFASKKIDFQFFLFRWVSCCFSQEYEIPEVLRVWDSALSSNRSFSDFFMLYSLAILKLKQEKLVKMSFEELMGFVLEDVSSVEIHKILNYIAMIDS